MSWASRRRSYIVGGFVFIIFLTLVPTIYRALQTEPSCFDGVKNLDEVGIDCGGSCTYLCPFQVAPLQVLWSRSFPVNGSTYNAVAFVENPNKEAAILVMPYVFRLYDSNNVLIEERFGETFISTQGITPIFEPRIVTGSRQAVRTSFELLGPSWWQELRQPKELELVSNRISKLDTTPRIDVQIKNDGFDDLTDVVIIGVVFDPQGNAIAASQTIIPNLPARATSDIFFTWPTSFEGEVGRIDIIPRIPPEAQL